MTVLERRRNRNAYFTMPIAYNADDAYRDALRLLRTNALAIRLKRLRETERIKIHFNNWEPEEGTPLDKWRNIWVESGVAEELPGRNNLKLLLPKSLKDIEGALHNIDDIRSTPHGKATFNLRLTSTSSSARRLRGAPKTYPDLDARSVPYTSQGNARGAPPSLRGTGARPSGR